MTITQVGAATIATTTLVGKTPTGVVAGDLLIFHLGAYDQNAAVLTPPAGSNITLINGGRYNHASGGDDAILVASYTCIAPQVVPATWTFTQSGGTGTNMDVVCTAWRYANQQTPTDFGAGSLTSNGGFGTAITGTGLTTSYNGPETIIWFWYGDDHPLTVAPSGYTQVISGTGAANNLAGGHMGLYTLNFSPASATGNITATAGTVSDDWVVQVMAIVPSFPIPAAHMLPTPF